jgi:hypothetical protein
VCRCCTRVNMCVCLSVRLSDWRAGLVVTWLWALSDTTNDNMQLEQKLLSGTMVLAGTTEMNQHMQAVACLVPHSPSLTRGIHAEDVPCGAGRPDVPVLHDFLFEKAWFTSTQHLYTGALCSNLVIFDVKTNQMISMLGFRWSFQKGGHVVKSINTNTFSHPHIYTQKLAQSKKQGYACTYMNAT